MRYNAFMMLRLRPYRSEDSAAILALFQDTIRRVNAADYGPEEIAAWSSVELEAEAWTARFAAQFVQVAEMDGQVAGFSSLASDGHVDRFYVSARTQRRGVGQALMESLLVEARRTGMARLYTESSVTARPFFERHGFVVLEEQAVHVRGAWLRNYRMERILVPEA